jgi:hypothetical protein
LTAFCPETDATVALAAFLGSLSIRERVARASGADLLAAVLVVVRLRDDDGSLLLRFSMIECAQMTIWMAENQNK